MQTVKSHKYKLIGTVMVLIIVLILVLTLSSSGTKPTPPPPGPKPKPPVPINSNVNPYYVKDGTLASTRATCSGQLNFNNTIISEQSFADYISNKTIKMDP